MHSDVVYNVFINIKVHTAPSLTVEVNSVNTALKNNAFFFFLVLAGSFRRSIFVAPNALKVTDHFGFGYFKQKEQVKSRGRELKGTDFSVNDQFPKEILERRKILFPIRRSLIQKGSRAVIAVDRLYVDGQLYRNLSTTPWLY